MFNVDQTAFGSWNEGDITGIDIRLPIEYPINHPSNPDSGKISTPLHNYEVNSRGPRRLPLSGFYSISLWR
jgi:hypothetical protein